MASSKAKPDIQGRIRATALRHAHDIEEKKKMQTKIADLIVEAFDLPSKPEADPAHPEKADRILFKKCLSVFQPSDLDDLVYERNVDDRCGYALCPRPKHQSGHNGQKIWNKKAGKDFKLVDRAEVERWCSEACRERTTFVRTQLSTEPAWLREVQTVDVMLLDEVREVDNIADAAKTPPDSQGADEDLSEKLRSLALERGEEKARQVPVRLVEKVSDAFPTPPSINASSDSVEGHIPQRVPFSDG